MNKPITLLMASLLSVGVAMAQTGGDKKPGGSQGAAAESGKKGHKGGQHSHKGGKKSKKGSAPSTPPPK